MDEQQISVKRTAGGVETQNVSRGNGYLNYTVKESNNGTVTATTDRQTSMVATGTNMVIGSNHNILIQAGNKSSIVNSCGGTIESVSKSKTNTTGSLDEFNNDHNNARYKAMMKTNVAACNNGRGTDMQGAATGYSSILQSAMAVITDLTAELVDFGDENTDDYTEANAIEVPTASGNFFDDTQSYITYGIEYATAIAKAKVAKLGDLLTLKNMRKKADNIRLNLLKAIEYTEKNLKLINGETAAELRNSLADKSDTELYLLAIEIQASAQVGATSEGSAIVALEGTDITLSFDINPANLLVNYDTKLMSDDDKDAANKALMDQQIDIFNETVTSGEYISAYSQDVASTVTQTPGSDIAIYGSTPNPLSATPTVNDTLAIQTATVQTAYGPEETSIFGGGGVSLTPDIESSALGGNYARVSMSNMDLFSGANITLQGNSSFMGSFPMSPVDFVCGKFSIFSSHTYITGCQDLILVSKNLELRGGPSIKMTGNVDMTHNLSVGGSVNIAGELYVSHLSTQGQIANTENMDAICPRINENSKFMTFSSLCSGRLFAEDVYITILGIPVLCSIINMPFTGAILSEQMNIYSETYSSGTPDIMGIEHEHKYTTPAYSDLKNKSAIAIEGIAAVQKVGKANSDGEILAEASKSKTMSVTGWVNHLLDVFNLPNIVSDKTKYKTSVLEPARVTAKAAVV